LFFIPIIDRANTPMPSGAMNKSPAALIESAFEADNDFATTLAKGMALLECFSAQRFSLSNAELAAATGLKRPTVARLTYTLTKLGYLKLTERGRYQLGVRVLSLTHPLLANLAVRQIARPLMQELASDVRGAVSIGVLEGCNLIYVETARSAETGPHLPDIGSTVAVLRTALGRALVSMLPKADREALEKRFAAEVPDLWKELRGALAEGIKSCETRGFSVSRGDLVQQTYAVGAPLFHDPRLGYFAINCGVQAFRLRADDLEENIGPRLTKLAATIRSLMPQNTGFGVPASHPFEPKRNREAKKAS
jgi:DNA-binding IclR family transcriptional regulator